MAVADSGSSPVETFMEKKNSFEQETLEFLDYVEFLRLGVKNLHTHYLKEQDEKDEKARTFSAALSSIEASADERRRCFAKAILEFTQYITTAFDLSSPTIGKSTGVFEELCHKMEHSDSKIVVSSPCTDKLFISFLKYENNWEENIRQSLKEENQSLVKERDMLDRRLKASEDEINQTKVIENTIKHLKESIREKDKELKKIKDDTVLSLEFKEKYEDLKDQIESKDNELRDEKNENASLQEKANMLKMDVSDLKEKVCSLENGNHMLEKEIKDIQESDNNKIAELKSQIEKLDKCNEDTKLELQTELKKVKEKYENCNLKLKSTEDENCDLTKKLKKLQVAINETIKYISKLESDCSLKDESIKKINMNIEGLKRELTEEKKVHDIKMKEVTNRETQCQKQLQECAKENNDLRSKYDQLNNHMLILGEHQIEKRKEYEGNIAKKDCELQQLASEITSLKLKIQHKDKELSDLNNGIQEVKMHLWQSEETNKTMEKSSRKMRRTLADREAQVEELQRTLEEFRRKFVTKVVLYCPRRANLMSEFEVCLKGLLESKLNEKNKTLVFEEHSDAQDVKMNDSKPTLVLCFFTSRLGTDAEKAIEGLQLTPKTVLVMIHPKDEHALPQQASRRILTDQKFSKLGAIVDMAYLRDKGIFPCEFNNNSIVKLVSFIKREGVEEREYK